MKVSATTVLESILLFVAVSLSGFFYVGISVNRVYLIFVGMVALMLCFVYFKPDMRIVLKDRFVKGYTLATLFSLFVILFYTCITYKEQGLKASLEVAYPYFMVIFAIPILCYLVHLNNEEIIFKTLNVFAVIWYMIALAQVILYPRIIIPDYFGGMELTGAFLRNDSIRIDLQMFGNLMIVYNFYKLYNGEANSKHKLVHLLLFLLGLYELVFVQQTRMYILCVGVCIMFVVKDSDGLFKKTVFFFAGLVFIFQTSYVSSLLESVFSADSVLGASTRARMYTLTYYLECFLNNPLCGFGFASGTLYGELVHGSIGYAYVEDLGVIGQLARVGIFVIPIYIVLLIRYFKILCEIKRNNDNRTYVLYEALFFYILLTSGTLSMLDQQRIMLYPLSIALFEFKHLQIVEKCNENSNENEVGWIIEE